MNLRFQNTFVNNTQFKVSLKLVNYLFLTVFFFKFSIQFYYKKLILKYFFKDTKYCDWANPNKVGVSGKNTTQENVL
jgi:hypothetical protein